MDYLVRSKDWITYLNLVPNMTSNTTPSGVCSASTTLDANHPAYYSFNAASNQNWHSGAGNPQWLMYKFDQPTVVNYVRLKTGGVGGPKTSVIQASTDNTNWIDLGDFLDCNSTNTWFEKYYGNDVAYTYYRIRITSSNYTSGDQYTTFTFLQFCTAGITNSERAMYFIGQNNYAANTLLADPDWLDAIYNNQYMEYILNTKVPVMTSNTTPYGEVVYSDQYSSTYAAFRAFDGNSSYHWRTTDNIVNGYIGYMFDSNACIKVVSIKNIATSTVCYIKNFKIRGGNNVSSLVDITGTLQNTSGSAVVSDFKIANNASYKTIVLNYINSYGSFVGADEIQFIGRTNV